MFQYISLAKITVLGKMAELLRYWPRSCLAKSQPFSSSSIFPTLGRCNFKKGGYEPISPKYKFVIGVCSEALKYIFHEEDLNKI